MLFLLKTNKHKGLPDLINIVNNEAAVPLKQKQSSKFFFLLASITIAALVGGLIFTQANAIANQRIIADDWPARANLNIQDYTITEGEKTTHVTYTPRSSTSEQIFTQFKSMVELTQKNTTTGTFTLTVNSSYNYELRDYSPTARNNNLLQKAYNYLDTVDVRTSYIQVNFTAKELKVVKLIPYGTNLPIHETIINKLNELKGNPYLFSDGTSFVYEYQYFTSDRTPYTVRLSIRNVYEINNIIEAVNGYTIAQTRSLYNYRHLGQPDMFLIEYNSRGKDMATVYLHYPASALEHKDHYRNVFTQFWLRQLALQPRPHTVKIEAGDNETGQQLLFGMKL